MPVVGSCAYILAHSGKTADVSAYNPDYKSKQIPIVDAVLQYNSPHDRKTYILVIRNALHVPSMDNHLIPPFMMREAVIKVNGTPKMQLDDPVASDHSIMLGLTLRIPLATFS